MGGSAQHFQSSLRFGEGVVGIIGMRDLKKKEMNDI